MELGLIALLKNRVEQVTDAVRQRGLHTDDALAITDFIEGKAQSQLEGRVLLRENEEGHASELVLHALRREVEPWRNIERSSGLLLELGQGF